MICQIQEFLSEGCSYREIAKRMGVGRNTIAKYREGDPKKLSMYGIQQSKLDIFYDFIIQCLDSKWSKSKTIKEIYARGYTGSKSNAFEYLCKIEQKENKYFEVQPYIRTMTEGLKYRTGSIGKEKDYITREGIFRYMWMNTELTVAHKNYIYAQYPAVWKLHCCIKEFRNIFKKRNVPLLYLFISNPIFHSEIYSVSRRTISSKSVMSLRPLTCHIPVIPGLMAILARWCSSYCSSSSGRMGRVPTRLMEPPYVNSETTFPYKKRTFDFSKALIYQHSYLIYYLLKA